MATKTKAQLIADNKALADKVAEMEGLNATILTSQPAKPNEPTLSKYMDELADIGRKGRVDSNVIKVIEKNDHKNISLWTKVGKRVGPIHPHNAKKTFELFWKLGIRLSATQPTKAMVDEYMETEEYKKWRVAFDKIRARKSKSKRSGEIEKLAKQMGIGIEKIASIMKPGDVGK